MHLVALVLVLCLHVRAAVPGGQQQTASSNAACPVSTQTHLNICLPRGRTTVSDLPPALQLRNSEAVDIHIANMSPLETCKIVNTTFTSAPPANAAQQAVTALAGIAPFGLGGMAILAQAPSAARPAFAFAPNQKPIDIARQKLQQANDQLDLLIGKRNTGGSFASEGLEQLLLEMQMARQQDGIALTAMYNTFQITDFRQTIPGGITFAGTYDALDQSFQSFLGSAPPGEDALKFSSYSVIQVDKNLYQPIPVSLNPKYAAGGRISDIQQQLVKIKDVIADARSTVAKDDAAAQALSGEFGTVDARYAAADNALTQVVQNDTSLRTQQTALAQLEINLQQLKKSAQLNDNWITAMDIPVPAARNGTVSGSVTCLNRLDNTKVTLDPTPYSVTYQVVPRLSLSTGVIFSPVPERTIGTTIEKTGVDTTGTATVQTVVSLTKDADVQVVPFTFLDLRLGNGWSYRGSGSDGGYRFLSKHVFSAGVSGGIGVNPNNGGPNAEFFGGLFGAIDRFVVHIGADGGRLTNVGGGFAIGDVVPAGTSIPVTSHYVWKFTVGLSVRLYP
jgi:hypothetical protein